MSKRWKQRPDGSTWGDWGEDDELGRVNLVTPEKVLEGVGEVRTGRTYSLSLSLDLPGGNGMNQRRYPPIIRPTEDLKHNQDVFYNVVAKEKIHYSFTDVWSDDVVTLWSQYSTQWDALVHQGALFDADGDGEAEPVYYNGFRPGTDIVGPQEDAKGDGSGSLAFSKHLGLENLAVHGMQGRAVLIDIAHHLDHTEEYVAVSMSRLREMIDADGVEIRPGDMVLLHTGYANKLVEWDGKPDVSRFDSMYPYLDASDDEVLEWIVDTKMSALVADNVAVEGWAAATKEPHTLLPVHHLCLFKLGVPLGELWYLEKLAAALREEQRTSFLLTAPPLRLPGVAGGPLTPIATL